MLIVRAALLAFLLSFGISENGSAEERPPTPLDTDGRGADMDSEDILDLDIDALGQVDVVVESFNVEVTSVTKTESTVGRSPAAIFVVTNEMIRRSGANSLPEVLRLVPGMQVVRLDANKWAVSSRGFNGQFSNKLLVMIDGRSLYSSIYSGVDWARHDTILQDIDRIEVIRGPGASVWGANAVNGVINIITKDSAETQGFLASNGIGSEDQNIHAFRYGGTHGANTTYRAYGKYSERDESYLPSGIASDDWEMGLVGTRIDWDSHDQYQEHLSAQFELKTGETGDTTDRYPIPVFPYYQSRNDTTDFAGGFAMLRYSTILSDESTLDLRGSYERRESNTNFYYSPQDIVELDLTHSFAAPYNQQWTWGLGYQMNSDNLSVHDPFLGNITPGKRTTNLFSGFAQDEIDFAEDWTLLIGCKLQHNDYSGFEYQPTIRLLTELTETQVLWGAVSRAVRTPARAESDFQIRIPTDSYPLQLLVDGNPELESEDLLSWELGYRAQPTETFSWDITGYYNLYSDLIAADVSGTIYQSPPTSAPTLPAYFYNSGNGRSLGFEIYGKWQTTENWNLATGYTFLDFHSQNVGVGDATFSYSRNLMFVQSFWNFSENVQLDSTLRYVDNNVTEKAPAYIEMDIRLGLQLTRDCDFSLVGQNLLSPNHRESGRQPLYVQRLEVERGIYGQLTWRH